MFKRIPVVFAFLSIFSLLTQGSAADSPQANPPTNDSCDSTPVKAPPKQKDAALPAKNTTPEPSKTTTPAPSTNTEPKPAAIKFDPFTGKVLGNKVRLRTQPDLDGKVIRELSKGDLLIVTGELNDFYAVKPPKGTKGYIFRSYVLDNVVEGNRVNVRLEPNLDAPVIAQLKGGEKVNGTISSINNKWLEIEAPSSTKFYVAKDYVQSVGTPEVYEGIQKRKAEVEGLLDKVYVSSQTELKKPFDQISLDHLYRQFNRIIQNYPDFPEQVTKAKEAMDLVQRTYLQKQIAFLESKSQQTNQNLEAKQSSANAEIEGYQKRLTDLEDQLKKERENKQQLLAATNQGTKSDTTQLNNQTIDPSQSQISNQSNLLPAATPLTAQMRYWASVEDGYYRIWLRNNPPQPVSEFYNDDRQHAITLQGIIEPYSQTIKNRPGDYILKVNHFPVAYLYSTKVDLQTQVGKNVKMTVMPRPNNDFAYPAYFVWSIE